MCWLCKINALDDM